MNLKMKACFLAFLSTFSFHGRADTATDDEFYAMLKSFQVEDEQLVTIKNHIECTRKHKINVSLKLGQNYSVINGKSSNELTNQGKVKFTLETVRDDFQFTKQQLSAIKATARVLNDEEGVFIQYLTPLIRKTFQYLGKLPDQGRVPAAEDEDQEFITQFIERAFQMELNQMEQKFGFLTPASPGVAPFKGEIGEYVIKGHPIDDVHNARDELHGRLTHRIQWYVICNALENKFAELESSCLEVYKLVGSIGGVPSFVQGEDPGFDFTNRSGGLWEQLMDLDASKAAWSIVLNLKRLLDYIFADPVRLTTKAFKDKYGTSSNSLIKDVGAD